jgi:hypothetical protein
LAESAHVVGRGPEPGRVVAGPRPHRTPPVLALQAVVGRRAPCSPSTVLALQRAYGNRAVTHLLAGGGHSPAPGPVDVQRRVAKSVANDALDQLLDPAAATSAKTVKKYRRGLGYAHSKLSATERGAAANDFDAAHAPLTLLEVVTPTVALAGDPRATLRDARKSMRRAVVAGGRSKLGVYYPGTMPQGPPIANSPEETVLGQLVGDARTTMGNIAGGNHDAAITLVFGPKAKTKTKVKTRFTDATAALNRLHTANPSAIHIDLREESAPLHVGGLTSPRLMTLKNDVVAARNNANQIKIIHESTHAIVGANVQDYRYRGTPGWTLLSTDVKLVNAAHFEAVAANVLDGDVPQEPPVVGGGVDAVAKERAKVNQWVTHGWIAAIRLHGLLVDVARRQRAAPAQSLAPISATPTKWLKNASRLLGLTMHHVAGPGVPAVSDLDLAAAEDQVSRLGDAIPAVRTKVLAANPKKTRVTRLKALTAHGLRKDADSSVATVDALVRLKDKLPPGLNKMPNELKDRYG